MKRFAMVTVLLVAGALMGTAVSKMLQEAHAEPVEAAKVKNRVVDLQKGDYDSVQVKMPSGWEVASVDGTENGVLVLTKPYESVNGDCKEATSMAFLVKQNGEFTAFSVHSKGAGCTTQKTTTTTVIER